MPTAAADPAHASAVALEGVRFAWGGDAGAFALAIDRLEIARGERVLLLGPSGSGKSTLLALLCGIAAPQAGRVAVLGTDLAALPGPARDRFRAEHLGIVFQMFNLLPYASALDNVLLPLSFAPGRRARLGRGARDEAMRLLTALGLPAERMGRGRAARLSIGQQQRVAVARALIGRPEIVVADEPTSALDPAAQSAFLALLAEQVGAAGATLVMVSHDDRIAPRFDRVLHLPQIARIGAPAAGGGP